MHLPDSQGFDSSVLAASCESKTNCYKIAVLKAVIRHVAATEGEQDFIHDRDLVVGMLEYVWYPAARYRLSLGHHDLLARHFDNVPDEMKDSRSFNSARQHVDLADGFRSGGVLRHPLSTILTHWLKPGGYRTPRNGQGITPQLRDLVSAEAERSNVPYLIEADGIRLRKPFVQYVLANHAVLDGWLDMHMIAFLQSRNPNVPGIPLKLRPEERPSLNRQKRLWSSAMEANGGFSCVYSRVEVDRADYHLDHFIPWAFVAHHRIWNLVPTTQAANLSKGSLLPPLETVDAMCRSQYRLYSYLASRGSPARCEFMAEYHDDLGIEPRHGCSFEPFRARYSEKVRALHSLASQRFRQWRLPMDLAAA